MEPTYRYGMEVFVILGIETNDYDSVSESKRAEKKEEEMMMGEEEEKKNLFI